MQAMQATNNTGTIAGSKEIDKTKYRQIVEEMLPFSCYVDPHTILTKNGEIMQTFCISSFKNIDNITGKMSSVVRRALENATQNESDKYSFWIHCVRSRNQDIVMSMNNMQHVGDIFVDTISDRWTEFCNSLNYYDTVCYITIVKQCLVLKLRLSNVPLFISGLLLQKHIETIIAREKAALHLAVKSVCSQLGEYYTERLAIQEENGSFNAPHLRLFSKILNFDNVAHKVPIANLSTVINKSKFAFEFGNIKLSSFNNDRKRFATIFTVKDPSCLHPEVLTALLNKSKDVITCEIFHKVEQEKGIIQYKQQSEIMSYFSGEGSVFNDVGFGSLAYAKPDDVLEYERKVAEENETPPEEFVREETYKQYVGFLLIAGSQASLNQSAKEFYTHAGELGLVIAQEDIGIERAFYSFLPGNFRFIKHTNHVTKVEVATCAFSYKFDNENIPHYVGQSPLFLLQTLNDHAYAFGIPSAKPDMLISSGDYRHSVIFSHMTALYYSMQTQVNIYVLSFQNHSTSFMKCLGGSVMVVRPEVDQETDSIDLFYSSQSYEEREDLIREILKSMEKVANIASDAAQAEIDLIAPALARCTSTEELHKAMDKFINKRFYKALQPWFAKDGEFARNVGIGVNFPVPESVERLSIVLSDKFLRPSHIKEFAVSLVLEHLYQRVANSLFPSVIILHNPFEICASRRVKNRLLDLIDRAHGRDTVMIFCAGHGDIKPDGCTLTKDELMVRGETEFHAFDLNVSEDYGQQYNLTEPELIAIKKMRGKYGSALLKQSGLLLPVYINFAAIKDILSTILCDNKPFQDRIAKCIEFFGDSNPQSWVKYFLDKEAKEALYGKTFNEEFVKKEIDDEELSRRKEKESLDERYAAAIIDAA